MKKTYVISFPSTYDDENYRNQKIEFELKNDIELTELEKEDFDNGIDINIKSITNIGKEKIKYCYFEKLFKTISCKIMDKNKFSICLDTHDNTTFYYSDDFYNDFIDNYCLSFNGKQMDKLMYKDEYEYNPNSFNHETAYNLLNKYKKDYEAINKELNDIKIKNENISRKLKDKEEIIQKQEDKIEQIEKELENKEKELENKTSEIQKSKERLEKQDIEIHNNKEKLDKQNNEILKYEEVKKEQDSKIKDYEEKIEMLEHYNLSKNSHWYDYEYASGNSDYYKSYKDDYEKVDEYFFKIIFDELSKDKTSRLYKLVSKPSIAIVGGGNGLDLLALDKVLGELKIRADVTIIDKILWPFHCFWKEFKNIDLINIVLKEFNYVLEKRQYDIVIFARVLNYTDISSNVDYKSEKVNGQTVSSVDKLIKKLRKIQNEYFYAFQVIPKSSYKKIENTKDFDEEFRNKNKDKYQEWLFKGKCNGNYVNCMLKVYI